MHKVGYRRGREVDPSRLNWDGDGPRPLSWSAWYPAASDAQETEHLVGPPGDPLFTMGPVADDATVSEAVARWPVVLVSHGTGGAADTMAWMGRRLAAEGFVCLSINHHGNTGLEPYRAEGFVCWWERSADFTVLLDLLEERGPFAGRLDGGAVFAAGFSLGAHTVLALAGAVTDIERFQNWLSAQDDQRGPREFPDVADHIPRLLETSDVFRSSWERHKASYADARIKAVYAMAPPPSVRGFTDESLSEISIPVSVIVGANDVEAPVNPCSNWLNDRLATGELTVLDPPVGHFVFLCEATPGGRKAIPEICVDPPGVDRAAIHDRAAQAAIRLFRAV